MILYLSSVPICIILHVLRSGLRQKYQHSNLNEFHANLCVSLYQFLEIHAISLPVCMFVQKLTNPKTLIKTNFNFHRCIVDTNFFLLRDHAAVVKDTRAVMRCPLRHCKAVIPCLPLINGDFRFKLVRPEDKVSFKEPKRK